VLRISIQNDSDPAKLKLEGKLIGPWASELNRVWSELKPSLGARKVCLDLCGVTVVDHGGARTLQDIFRCSGAEIIADTPLARYFATKTMCGMPRKDTKEN